MRVLFQVSPVPFLSFLGCQPGFFLFLLLVDDVGQLGDTGRFADDTTLLFHETSSALACEFASIHLCELSGWFAANSLQLNESKTWRLVHSLSRNLLPVLNGPVNFLRFHLDYRLDWNTHVDANYGKLSQVI